MTQERREVTVIDVFPRDGMQTVLHEPDVRLLSTSEKIEVIRALDEAGVEEIEITSFVHPKVIPSLADAEDVAKAVLDMSLGATLRSLVPNYRGAQRALAAGVRDLSCLIVASETYQRLNANMSVEENFEEIRRILELVEREGAHANVVVAMGFVCPYEGIMEEERVLALIDRFVDMGVDDVTVADSVGLAWPTLVRERFGAIARRWPELKVGFHIHTLAGLALANAFAAYEAGVRRFEGSVGGIGGGIAMPMHTTEMGNVATEDLVYLFESCGIPTGVNQEKLAALGHNMQEKMGTGGGHTSAFGTLSGFVEENRSRLAELSKRPPGASRGPDSP